MSNWDIRTLHEELSRSELTRAGARFELVGGESIVATMAEHGDLEIQLALSGEQIFVSAPLCRASQVRDRARFNEACLKLNPINPLSNIGLIEAGGDDLYVVFGELSSRAPLDNVVEEIRVLADNTIDAAEMFASELVNEGAQR